MDIRYSAFAKCSMHEAGFCENPRKLQFENCRCKFAAIAAAAAKVPHGLAGAARQDVAPAPHGRGPERLVRSDNGHDRRRGGAHRTADLAELPFDAITAVLLGAIERPIDDRKQVSHSGIRIASERDAAAHARQQLGVAEARGCGSEIAPHAIGDGERLVEVADRHAGGEFLAADARE